MGRGDGEDQGGPELEAPVVLDGEPVGFDGGEGVAAGVAASPDAGPDGAVEGSLDAGQAWMVGDDVFVEAKLTAGS